MSDPRGNIFDMNTATAASTTQPATMPTATLIYSLSREIVGVEVEGREHRVVAPALRYFERVDRWWTQPGLRLPRGTGAGVIDQEILRLEVQRGSVNSQITTMELVLGRDGSWGLREVLRAA